MKLLNSNRFYLPGTAALHLASISDGLREYICFHLEGRLYIEEITGGIGPQRIEDDDLHTDLCRFVEYHRLCDLPMVSDEWKKEKRSVKN